MAKRRRRGGFSGTAEEHSRDISHDTSNCRRKLTRSREALARGHCAVAVKELEGASFYAGRAAVHATHAHSVDATLWGSTVGLYKEVVELWGEIENTCLT